MTVYLKLSLGLGKITLIDLHSDMLVTPEIFMVSDNILGSKRPAYCKFRPSDTVK